jgi:hypothetical protein
VQQQSQTSDSSASSTAPTSRRPEPLQGLGRQRPTGPLSPKRTAQLSGKRREGSDGTPSMGSSFSDLDGKLLFPLLYPLPYPILLTMKKC